MFEFTATGVALADGEIGYAHLTVVTVLLLALAATGWLAVKADGGSQLARGLTATRAALRLEALPVPVFVLALLLWASLTLVLVAGLYALIGSVLFDASPPPGEEGRPLLWEFRFKLAQLAVLTTVLGALVALPITLNRLKLSREANETAKDTLFNAQITEAAADLHAQRQVTRRYADGRLRDEYEDDVIRRHTAIDRLEGLVKERPKEADRVARLLSLYVREMSRELPPVSPPETEDVEAIKAWARSLKPARSDMENAVKVLGRLTATAGLAENTLPIDLRGANLQGFDMQALDLSGADLSRAHMQGTDLRRVRIEGAVLRNAQMQGANLGGSWMQAAILSMAQMQGADLARAQTQSANLLGAQIQGANLNGADMHGTKLGLVQMQGANLIGAKMQGANLMRAQMQGANLARAQMDDSTMLPFANFRGAAVRAVDEVTIIRLRPFWQDIFADGNVQVPEGERPGHWAHEKLGREFHDRWRAWQRKIGFDPDNPG